MCDNVPTSTLAIGWFWIRESFLDNDLAALVTES